MDDMDYSNVVAEYNSYVNEYGPELTVFMTTHNREHFAKLAIDSFLEQDYCFAPLVVLDNMSEDSTHDMVENFNSKKIFYLKRDHQKHFNDINNVQFAFKTCKTKYIMVIHDDDILKPNFLSTLLNYMNNNIDISVTTVSADIIDENGKVTGNIQHSRDMLTFSNHEYFDNFFSRHSTSPIYPSAIYRTSFFDDCKKYICIPEVGPANDQFIWFQTERNGGKITILPDNCFQYRKHSNQDSNVYSGFMELMLINYLYKDEYYLRLMKQNVKGIRYKVWSVFKQISLKYYKGKIDGKAYKRFFDYEFLRDKAIKFKLLKYNFFYLNRYLCKLLYKVFIR